MKPKFRSQGLKEENLKEFTDEIFSNKFQDKLYKSIFTKFLKMSEEEADKELNKIKTSQCRIAVFNRSEDKIHYSYWTGKDWSDNEKDGKIFENGDVARSEKMIYPDWYPDTCAKIAEFRKEGKVFQVDYGFHLAYIE